MCYIKYFETSVTLKWDTKVAVILVKFETSLKMCMKGIRKLLSTYCLCYIKYIEISLVLYVVVQYTGIIYMLYIL